jgi:hypothetical protein
MTITSVQPWDGSRVCGDAFAIAAVTDEAPDPGGGAPPVVAAVVSGPDAWVIAPTLLGQFIRRHRAAMLACHDVGTLHLIIHEHLGTVGDAAAQQILWDWARDGRLYDVGLLHQLVALTGEGGRRPPYLALDELAKKHGTATAAYEQDFRQWLAASSLSPPAFAAPAVAAEALRQADAVRSVMAALWPMADECGLVPPTGTGAAAPAIPPLAVQVQGAVALAHARRHGLRLAAGAMKQIVDACEAAYQCAAARLLPETGTFQLLKRGRDGRARRRKDGSPDIDPRRQKRWLGEVSDSIRGFHQTECLAPLGQDGLPSANPEDWRESRDEHRLLSAWFDLSTAPEVGRSFAAAADGRVRPAYEVLPRLHSRQPDLDFVQRLGLHDAFEPTPAHVFCKLRLTDVALRCLAAECLHRFRKSALADLFVRHDDPIEHGAAALAELPRAEFTALRQAKPSLHEHWRRVARAILVAAPRGLSVDRVAEIVCDAAGQGEVAPAQVKAWHKRLCYVTFPELSQYLADDTFDVMAWNMGTTTATLCWYLDRYFPSAVPPPRQLRKWFQQYGRLRGPIKETLTALIQHCAESEAVRKALETQAPEQELYRVLFVRRAATLAGRVRGGLSFAQARGAAYLDLADDAIKSAVFAVVAGGFRAVAVVGETALVELPEGPDVIAQVAQARHLAQQGAQAALPGVPAACAADLLTSW